ncbi:MAG: type II toxin-antitoxin system RelE/ParE family toxin [Betaproteobacteria bacterium]|nr:type II toxin-antitoxin system RelE/ParE family toxin [Betaproteobacteria bacterium]
MPQLETHTAKRLDWAPKALQAYVDSLARIASDDPLTAERVRKRVEHALDLIREYPGIGTPAARRGERRFPISKTGHVIVYRVTRTAVRIHIWYRARQNVRR